jgi:DNA polymerase-3 subunit gamma/tau
MAWIMAGQQHLRASEVQVKNTSQPRLWLEVTLMGLLPGVRSQESGVRSQQSAVSNQESAISNQQSAISSQQLAVSNQESAVSSQQSAVSNQESAVSSQELGSGSREVGVGRQGLGNGAEGLAPLTAGDGELASSDGGVGHPLEQVFEPVVPGATPAKFEVAASGSPDLESGGQEQIELKQIWQQVIEYLHPLSKGLLRDHGRLAGLSEQQAQIEITAPKLLKIAQSKISDIEKSFAKVVNRPVKVNLTIAITPRVESETPQPSADLALGGADGASVTTAMMANDYPVPHSSQSPSGVSQSQVASEQQFSVKMPTQSDVSLPSQRSQTAADTQELSSNPNPLDYQVPQKKWQEEDEVTRAAKSIAQMFNGQIVNLADDLESPLDSEGSVASRDSFNLPEGELADDDVPF